MLKLKNITKSYKTGDFEQKALAGVSLTFRENEFVAILGQSGSGKTTMLNVIGGLDRYDSGDLEIDGKSTKKFSGEDWDAYRNNCVGFIFQSYNLISHISILANIEMSMTLSGVPAAVRKSRAMEVLKRVGLEAHAGKKPNQLSGGQMQRVAIARALVNDPEVILADEPTGALDSETSVSIMELIREIAHDKLVVMVTHNPELAKKYATRVVELSDGAIISDSDPVADDMPAGRPFSIKRTAMSFFTALHLSFNNIRTKMGRTLLTAFASSIGIIGIALVLSLSNGFDIKVSQFESETMGSFPIMITRSAMEVNSETMEQMRSQMSELQDDSFPEEELVYPYDPSENTIIHANDLTNEYVDYVEKVDPSLISGIYYIRATGFNLLRKDADGAAVVSGLNLTCLPERLERSDKDVVSENYDTLYGSYPQNANELLLVVDSRNRLEESVLKALGLDADAESIPFEDIVGTELKLLFNDDFYVPYGGLFIPNMDFASLYDSENAVTLKISGIARIKEDSVLPILPSGLCYTDALFEMVTGSAEESAIVKAQRDADYNVMTGEKLEPDDEGVSSLKNNLISYLGGDSVPYMINIFPLDFDSKDALIEYLDAYNTGREDDDMIIYTDMASTISSLSGDIMNAITIVLVAFSAISLIVSVIMIGIIIYISVLERTKEIGILRSLGARKKDITRVFNAETFIIGTTSGFMGILIARLLLIPANEIIYELSNLEDVARMNPLHALLLVAISVTLTIIGGLIPAVMASKRDPVAALRSE